MRQEIQINNYKDNFQTETTMRIITKIYQNTIIITIINIYIYIYIYLGYIWEAHFADAFAFLSLFFFFFSRKV